MSSFRQIHSRIWKDDWFLDLEPTDKLFFIYLFSNESASLAGIYELSIRVMSFESGLTAPEIRDAFKIFTDAQKAYYEDGVVWIPKLRKYHETQSPKVQTRIIKDVTELKSCNLKWSYCEVYGIDRVSVGMDRVSIPPYTYTSTSTSPSTSSLKGGVGGNEPYNTHPENTPPMETMSAIAAVVKETLAPGFNEGKFENAAHVILALDATNSIPGFAPWWQRNTYYSDNGKPSIKTFLDEFQNYLDGVERAASPAGKPALTQTQINLQNVLEQRNAKR